VLFFLFILPLYSLLGYLSVFVFYMAPKFEREKEERVLAMQGAGFLVRLFEGWRPSAIETRLPCRVSQTILANAPGYLVAFRCLSAF